VQLGDVFALGVQRVRGDHHTGQVDIGQVQLILAENTRRFNARPVPQPHIVLVRSHVRLSQVLGSGFVRVM
jgi:hypothetical protein